MIFLKYLFVFIFSCHCCLAFTRREIVIYSDWGFSPKKIVTADMNKDGKSDVIVSGTISNKAVIMLFLQGEKGIWPSQPDVIIKPEKVASFATGDLDGDQLEDIVVVSSHNFIFVYLNSENFSKKHKFHYGNQWLKHISIGKITSTGITDVLIGPAWRKFHKGMNVEFGYIAGPKLNDNFLEHITDLDMDKNTDLVFTSPHHLRIYYGPFLYLYLKPVVLAKYRELTLPESAGFLASGDLNEDERADIVASRPNTLRSGRKTFIYLQNTPVGFDMGQNPTCIIDGVCGPVVIADFDSDGKNELAIGDREKGVAIYSLQVKDRLYATTCQKSVKTAPGILKNFSVSYFNSDKVMDFALLIYSPLEKKGFVKLLMSNK